MIRHATIKRGRRAGMILAIVLIALIIVMLLGAAIANTLVIHSRNTRRIEQQQQALWLVESAAQRAVYRLANDSEYEGETWEVAAQVLGKGNSGLAVIQIEKSDDLPGSRWIIVEATYPAGSIHRTQFRKARMVEASPGGSS